MGNRVTRESMEWTERGSRAGGVPALYGGGPVLL